MSASRRLSLIVATWLLVWMTLSPSAATTMQTRATVVLRGHAQSVSLYGRRGDRPVVVSSGDGGWVHLAPHVAEFLAGQGFFVVGFDTKAYLESFTERRSTLTPQDEPGDYKVLADFAAQGATGKPILIGVSEGAGLSLLAATDPATKRVVGGVIGLGLPNINELGWRWRDAMIYVTHGVPNEPTFSTVTLADRVSPIPLAAIHSTRDEFVPLSEVQRVLDAAKDPKRLWVVTASDHRFSDNLPEFDRRLLDAIAWVSAGGGR